MQRAFKSLSRVLRLTYPTYLPVSQSFGVETEYSRRLLDKRHQPTRYYLMQVQLHNSSKYLCTHVGTLLCNLLRDPWYCRACRWFSEEQIGSTYSCCTGDLINLPSLYIIMPGECQWCRTESVNIIVPVDLWLAFKLTTEEEQTRGETGKHSNCRVYYSAVIRRCRLCFPYPWVAHRGTEGRVAVARAWWQIPCILPGHHNWHCIF